MEKALNVSHAGSSKGKWGNPAQRQARSGSYSPGSGAVSDTTHPSQTQKRHLEGVLNKYTNLLQGWQSRYFVLDPELVQLQYFISEHSKNQKPRGSLPLIGSSVAPSDEFPFMFTVFAANGDLFKLRACDAREQQMWMTQLQLCARRHSDSSAKVMSQAEGQQKNLVNSIESLPSRGPLSSLDQDLLLLKATSAATLSCLGECLSILQHNVCQAAQHITHSHMQGSNSDNISGWSRPKAPSEDQVKNGELTGHNTSVRNQPHSPVHRNNERLKDSENSSRESVDHSEEITDTEDNEEEDLGVLDDQRSVILHLLSQLKLGMDLTRVVLPTFILEKRSLLEMYANFMAHPDVFLAITSGATPEERIIRFVEYYLTAFHEGRKGAVAKKPYNPILGESFHCTWDVPRDKVRPLRSTNSSPAPLVPQSVQTASNEGVGACRLHFVAEQVSHHPPVSGFYCECKECGICVNTHVWTKSKFMGMSIGVSMVGEEGCAGEMFICGISLSAPLSSAQATSIRSHNESGVLHLLEHDEEYVFTLPSAYARSILTVPWVELGGKVSICCVNSGYSAAVTFHTKPFYGGKVHRVTAEVKHNPTGTIVCKAQGEWNGTLEFTYSSGETKVIDTSKLPVIKKKIRPLEKQGQYESRRLWQHVTVALKAGDIDTATEHKHQLEERQRREGKQRAASSTPWKPKYFIKEGEGWVYHNPLWKTK
ncbi:oxysterol-binding protein-related protein 10-like isoform X3 [Myxocyprinus asiaticus]|uniref:oxysterol-binding protein-related protein 10-like isoform X3 n=1 Tax=Myxocyprinus asiaticus TaxID=70543 RepID=UPI0022217672|nr:oxysterol-binding protein-related protein 10-like isoform X3 [Myxocyprinus asiaticus]